MILNRNIIEAKLTLHHDARRGVANVANKPRMSPENGTKLMTGGVLCQTVTYKLCKPTSVTVALETWISCTRDHTISIRSSHRCTRQTLPRLPQVLRLIRQTSTSHASKFRWARRRRAHLVLVNRDPLHMTVTKYSDVAHRTPNTAANIQHLASRSDLNK